VSAGPAERVRPVPRPTRVEILANLLLGDDETVPPLPAPTGRGVHAALEEALLGALQRPPCIVSFSGGRDSSAVLATATTVARRHGLADPIPAIMRFAAAPQTDETAWQELVLTHLRLARVEVLELHDELDALGPFATGVLRRHGVRWPGNAYMHAPLLELADGGSLLTGIGGDELFGTTAARHVLIARRMVRPRPRDLRAFALASLPRSVRALVWTRRSPPPYPWLTSRGVATVHRALAADDVSWPARWDRSLRHWYASRAFAALDGVLDLVADQHDVRILNPLLEPTVLAELAVAGGAAGFASRDAAMRELFGTLLPEPILTRPTKAAFTGPLWGPAVREFAGEWRGEGVDERDVDIEALRAQWLAPDPNFRTVLLLHAAWAAARGRGSAQRAE
jgi:hypothetical protein